MKKVAIRKLNRTQLAKEGTKQIYITGHFLLDFFGYKSINDLASDDGVSHKKKFYRKADYYHTPDPEPIWINLTKATQEVRIAGFVDLLPDGYSETDYVVLEAIETDNEEVIYLFDVVKHPNIIVLRKYQPEDDAGNYTTYRDNKGKIRFNENETRLERPADSYWLWDNNCTPDILAKIIDTPIDAFLVFQGSVKKKTVRITGTGSNFSKLLKGQSNLKNNAITQEKFLYLLEEKTKSGWVQLDDLLPKLLEITYQDSHIVIANRDANSYACYGGK